MNTSNNLGRKNKSMVLNVLVKKLLLIVISLIFAAVAISNMLIVREDEIIVIEQFGIIEKIIDKPGIYFKLPITQSISSLTKKLSSYMVQSIKAITADERDITATSYVIWRITDPQSFINNVDMGAAEILIEQAVSSELRQKYSGLQLKDIIGGLDADKDINDEISEKVRKQLKDSGIDILDVRLVRIEFFPDEIEMLYEKMIEEREKIAKQYIAAANDEASRMEAEADNKAKIILSNAYAASEITKSKADSEAAKIYAASYNKDPEFYRFIRTLESYKKTLSGKTTIVLPINSPYTKYLTEN